MAPVTQYVFAEMLGISEHFTAGSHEWLPYSVIPTFPKLICKHQFTVRRNTSPGNTCSPAISLFLDKSEEAFAGGAVRDGNGEGEIREIGA